MRVLAKAYQAAGGRVQPPWPSAFSMWAVEAERVTPNGCEHLLREKIAVPFQVSNRIHVDISTTMAGFLRSKLRV